jgi:putative addiction module component (TIGR02574 family)
MTIREQVLQEALALPPEDRVFLVEQLEASVSHGEFTSREVAAAWTAEIDRRIAAYERGEVQASDATAAIERMRSSLADHRNFA